MISYNTKQNWKFVLFIAAIVIGATSLLYTSLLVKKLSVEERKKIELWAEAYRELDKIGLEKDISGVLLQIIRGNTTIPLILIDEEGNIIGNANLDSAKIQRSNDGSYLRKQLEIMKEQHEPLEISLYDGEKQYVYYKGSVLLKKLFYYPIVQIGIIGLFIFVSYLAFSNSRKSEQNQVWVGMSKETAHQLGTPISSLIAFVELLKLKNEDTKMINEVEKDVKRLQTITDRFSKIGSMPVLEKVNINKVLMNAMSYIKTRTSNKISYNFNFSEKDEINVPLNVPLFEWVIENITKNAIDAMKGEGEISIAITDNVQVIYIDIKDTGKGIAKSKYKTIFQPGYTTKKRGWGLGLSLSKRIIELNHNGKIFVKSSEANKGTTFRIVLKK